MADFSDKQQQLSVDDIFLKLEKYPIVGVEVDYRIEGQSQLVFLIPKNSGNNLERLQLAALRMDSFSRTIISKRIEKVQILEKQWHLVSPQNILERGFSFILHESKVITASTQLQKGDLISIRFAKGSATSKIEDIQK